MITDDFIVLCDSIPVSSDIFSRHFGRAIRVLVAVSPSTHDRRRCIRAVNFTKYRAIVTELGHHCFPWLLGNDQNTDAKPRHDLRRLGRDRGRISSSTKGLEWPRPEVSPDLVNELAVKLAVTSLQTF